MGIEVLVENGHVFETDEDGYIDDVDMGDHHSGPHCVLCHGYWCKHCEPDIFKEKCPERLETLPGLEYPQPIPPPPVVGRRNANLPTISRLPLKRPRP